MAEKKKKVTSAVMVVEYKVIKNRRGSIELSNGGLKPITDSGSVVELPDIKRSGTPRSDLIPSRQSSARRGSRQEELLKSMIDQFSANSSTAGSVKGPTHIPTQIQNALLKHGAPVPQKGRRMSVQERIVIMKETPSRCSSANSKALLARRNTEPLLAFAQNAPVNSGSGLRSDGNTTNTTGSSSNINGAHEAQYLNNNRTERDTEIVTHRQEDIAEEDEIDPNSPGVKLAIAKCQSWIKDLPEKFSGLNVLTFPDIQSNK